MRVSLGSLVSIWWVVLLATVSCLRMGMAFTGTLLNDALVAIDQVLRRWHKVSDDSRQVSYGILNCRYGGVELLGGGCDLQRCGSNLVRCSLYLRGQVDESLVHGGRLSHEYFNYYSFKFKSALYSAGEFRGFGVLGPIELPSRPQRHQAGNSFQ